MDDKTLTAELDALATLSKHLKQGDKALAQNKLGRAMQQYTSALQDTTYALDIIPWLRDAALAKVQERIARVHEAKGEYKAALTRLREAATVLKNERGYPNRNELADLHERMAAAHQANGDTAKAQNALRRAGTWRKQQREAEKGLEVTSTRRMTARGSNENAVRPRDIWLLND